jgi:hypothetical protein
MAILHRHFRYDLSVSFILRIGAERTHNSKILNCFYGGRMADVVHRNATRHSPNDGGSHRSLQRR